MNTAELINNFLDRADGSMDHLKLHYGPLIRYVITPILPDERDRERDGAPAVTCPDRCFIRRTVSIIPRPSIHWRRNPIRRTPSSGAHRPPAMYSQNSPYPTGAKIIGAMSPIPWRSFRRAGALTVGSTISTRLPGPSIPLSPPKRNSRPWVWAVRRPSKPFRMPCSFSRGLITQSIMIDKRSKGPGAPGPSLLYIK